MSQKQRKKPPGSSEHSKYSWKANKNYTACIFFENEELDDFTKTRRITKRRDIAIEKLADRFMDELESHLEELPVDIYFNLKGLK